MFMNDNRNHQEGSTFDYPLYLVSDERSTGETLAHIVREALFGGVSIVQLRHKDNDIRAFIKRAETVKYVIDQFNLNRRVDGMGMKTHVPFIINDRVDVALAVEADGVHLGQSDMPAVLARQLIGEKKILGLTVETPQQLLEAQMLPVDYLGISTIFNTATKSDTKHEWRLEGLTQAVKSSALPLVAIGGIDEGNIARIAQTKVGSIALVSAIFSAQDPKAASAQLVALIKSETQ
ncbi:Thiamin-phosphate pyrophosphorylase [Vibrio casei]|nr:Thiamin-phosphate pyrophosphorylase [Vibrio casei]